MKMSKSRGVLIVLLLAGILWALSLSTWQAGPPGGGTLGPAGVATPEQDAAGQASPVATACVAVIAVCGLLAAMLGRLGRLVVLGLAGLAALGYAATALSTTFQPGSTGWAVAGILAGVCAAGVIVTVAFASARWTNSNRYDRDARTAATPEEFDSTAAWDALSRGDDPDAPRDDPDAPGNEPQGR
ncbi:Trp biosynthesis-associated membrane protein [Brevibacterium sp.]|uniref:Trp biosynthesis-associated membrane protein n=1 Tax=Brevibacterium sp. TaxID=1701 RepID=UPI0028123345|nr:Trp biosynthesis-associated membrane protein [Brevibacterium sp.]